MVGQGHFCKLVKSFGRIYLPFIDGGTTLNSRSLLTSMTVCIESCGTGDMSSRGVFQLGFPIRIHSQFFVSQFLRKFLFQLQLIAKPERSEKHSHLELREIFVTASRGFASLQTFTQFPVHTENRR